MSPHLDRCSHDTGRRQLFVPGDDFDGTTNPSDPAAGDWRNGAVLKRLPGDLENLFNRLVTVIALRRGHWRFSLIVTFETGIHYVIGVLWATGLGTPTATNS